MSNKIKRCNNALLKNLLKDRDTIFEATINEAINNGELDDLQLKTINNICKLQPFEKDLLYLRSLYSVQLIAETYCVSKAHIYNQLNKIQNKLNQK